MTQSALRPASALAEVGVRPRKSRGQNFLVQRRVAERIVAAAEIAPGDSILEIGPGLGILTERIISTPLHQLTLIELDAQLAASLESRFRTDPRVRVFNRDLLSLNLDELMGDAPFKVIGNLPFNIAGAILEHLCSYCEKTPRMALMFQREVAERIRARVGAREYSALSAFTAMYWDILAHFPVAAGNFHPRPKVDAEVLVFAPGLEGKFERQEERAVLATIRAAFSAPRKTIRNSLAGGLGINTGAAEAGLASAGIEVSVRPANLAVADFVRLARALRSLIPLGIRDA